MKVLFLDIDGVLNSRRSQVAFGGYPHSFSPPDMARFDHVAIALVRRLCHETDCSVVLSSSWRYTESAHAAANALDLPIMGATPTGSYFATRGDEIAAWLAEHPEVVAYAIVDDLEPMLPGQQPYFVQTDDAVGLSLADYTRLRTILGEKKSPGALNDQPEKE